MPFAITAKVEGIVSFSGIRMWLIASDGEEGVSTIPDVVPAGFREAKMVPSHIHPEFGFQPPDIVLIVPGATVLFQ